MTGIIVFTVILFTGFALIKFYERREKAPKLDEHEERLR